MTSGQSHQPAKPCGEMILILKNYLKKLVISRRCPGGILL